MTQNFLSRSSNYLVIDVPVKGWAKDHTEQLLKRYTDVRIMGTFEELTDESDDDKIVEYCMNNSSDLLTKDKRAYTFAFKVGVKKVLIERCGVDEGHNNAPVFILRFLD